MAACDFFDFLAFVGFFDLSVEAIEALPLPPLPAAAGVRVVTPNRLRAAMIAISLIILVLRVCPSPPATPHGLSPWGYTPSKQQHADPKDTPAILSLGLGGRDTWRCAKQAQQG